MYRSLLKIHSLYIIMNKSDGYSRLRLVTLSLNFCIKAFEATNIQNEDTNKYIYIEGGRK